MSLLQNADAISVSARPAEFGRADSISVARQTGPAGYSSKRVFDISCTILLLLFFAPAMMLIWLVLAGSGGKPVFAQMRVGQGGRVFRCYKFRSMVNDANQLLTVYLESNPSAREEWNRSFKLVNDPRVTPFGHFLRRSSLDELPQLVNVLLGDMSLVGPRPIVASEVDLYRDKISAYYRCRPGLTGLWQVSGRNLIPYERRIRIDAFYARKQSLALDTAILFRTIGAVISGRGAC